MLEHIQPHRYEYVWNMNYRDRIVCFTCLVNRCDIRTYAGRVKLIYLSLSSRGENVLYLRRNNFLSCLPRDIVFIKSTGRSTMYFYEMQMYVQRYTCIYSILLTEPILTAEHTLRNLYLQ